jgi:DNA-binding GntR family transcriptional regulator
VSHIPVREALARLEEEGLVEREPRRGARVAGLSRRGLEETSSLRAVLEGLVVQRVQERWDTAASARLARIVEQMERAAEQGDIDRVLEQDLLFHEELWRLADHALLLDVVGQLRGRVVRFFRLAAASLPPEDLIEHARSHRAILEVIDSGDTLAADHAMRAHIEIAADRILDAGLIVDEPAHDAAP